MSGASAGRFRLVLVSSEGLCCYLCQAIDNNSSWLEASANTHMNLSVSQGEEGEEKEKVKEETRARPCSLYDQTEAAQHHFCHFLSPKAHSLSCVMVSVLNEQFSTRNIAVIVFRKTICHSLFWPHNSYPSHMQKPSPLPLRVSQNVIPWWHQTQVQDLSAVRSRWDSWV